MTPDAELMMRRQWAATIPDCVAYRDLPDPTPDRPKSHRTFGTHTCELASCGAVFTRTAFKQKYCCRDHQKMVTAERKKAHNGNS